MEMAKIGATPDGGVCRLALTDQDRAARDLFVRWCKDLGGAVRVDQMGNIFARWPGQNPSLDPILLGSHLDSQPTGGKFDGTLGVLAGLEVVETLRDHQLLTTRPLEVVSWTNEEGARFAPAMISSGVFAGVFTLEEAYASTDSSGLSLGQELERIGYLGSAAVGADRYHAAFELHIEQGPILEDAGSSIGVVTGVQGIRWYDLVIKGKETHAGPCPMPLRADPVHSLAQFLPEVYALANAYAPAARLTIGRIETTPGVRNTVAGEVRLSLDLRHPDASTLNQMDADLRKTITRLQSSSKTEASLHDIWYAPPVHFAPDCIEAVRQAAIQLQYTHQNIVSGAGHDAVYLARRIPTSMIFIPCKDGLSHNPLESCELEHIQAGANVLLGAVRYIDTHEVTT